MKAEDYKGSSWSNEREVTTKECPPRSLGLQCLALLLTPRILKITGMHLRCGFGKKANLKPIANAQRKGPDLTLKVRTNGLLHFSGVFPFFIIPNYRISSSPITVDKRPPLQSTSYLKSFSNIQYQTHCFPKKTFGVTFPNL